MHRHTEAQHKKKKIQNLRPEKTIDVAGYKMYHMRE